MALMGAKNYALSPAAADLGMGEQLLQQLKTLEMERKKKLQPEKPSAFGDSVLAPAVLFPPIGGQM